MMRRWLLITFVLLTGCTTVHNLGGGRYVVPAVIEVRSPFGTNMGFAMAQTCDGIIVHEEGLQPLYPRMDYRNCQPLTGWVPMSSQGQGGQIVNGMMNALGFGILGATMPGSGNALSQSQSVTVAPAKGHR